MGRLIAHDRAALKPMLLDHTEHLGLIGMLHNMGIVKHATFALGAHVLSRMLARKTRQITLSLDELRGGYLMSNGEILAGPTPDGGIAYITALQELHSRGKILNSYRESDLNREDAGIYHFSLNPTVTFGMDWTTQTPITYRLYDAPANEIGDEVRRTQNHAYSGLTAHSWGV